MGKLNQIFHSLLFLSLLGISQRIAVCSASRLGKPVALEKSYILPDFYDVTRGDGRYLVRFNADFVHKSILFEVIVATTGFVGLGVSLVRGMAGADIVIGGVQLDGSTYFGDYHGIGNQAPVIDERSDWTLISAVENNTHTFLTVSRLWDTGDKDHDLVITNVTMGFIWAYGTTDTIQYHGGVNRGTNEAEFLEPPSDASEKPVSDQPVSRQPSTTPSFSLMLLPSSLLICLLAIISNFFKLQHLL